MFILPGQDIGVFLAQNGPAPNRGRDFITFFIVDLSLGDTPWVDLELACPSSSDAMEIKQHPKLSKSRLNVNDFDIEGTYGNFAYGNLTVYLEDDVYYMRYGKDALFIMEDDGDNVYTTRGADVLWRDSYRLRFSEV